MSVTRVSLHSYKTKNPNFFLKSLHPKTIIIHVNAWTLVKLFWYSFSFISICTFHKKTFVHIVTHHNAMKVMKRNEKLEHILDTWMFHDRKQNLTHFHGFIHSFTFCVFQVKYSVSQLFFVGCSLCLYQYTDFKLEAAHEQVTITTLIQNILLGTQKGHTQREFSYHSVLWGEWFAFSFKN